MMKKIWSSLPYVLEQDKGRILKNMLVLLLVLSVFIVNEGNVAWPPVTLFLSLLPLAAVWACLHNRKSLYMQLPLSAREQVQLAFGSGLLFNLAVMGVYLFFYVGLGPRSPFLSGVKVPESLVWDYWTDLAIFLLLSVWVYELAFPNCVRKDGGEAFWRCIFAVFPVLLVQAAMGWMKTPVEEDGLRKVSSVVFRISLTDSAVLPMGFCWAAGLLALVVLPGIGVCRYTAACWEKES